MTRTRNAVVTLTSTALGLLAFSVGMEDANAQAGRGLLPIQQRLLSGFASFSLESNALLSQPPSRGQSGISPGAATNYTPGANGSCGPNIGSNNKVNQNCENLADPDLAGRSQAQNETSIAQDPNAPRRMVAAYNDYRRGDGTCGVSWSLNGGTTWQDSTVPNGFVRGGAFGAARQYFQSSGDPSVAFDSKGNVYLSCQMFLRGAGGVTPNEDLSSGLYVFRSTGNFGASWNFPARHVVEQNDVLGTGAALLDKQLMTVDASPASPFVDRIYMTWTFFDADGTAYIYAAHSSDYGETFSAPVVVSNDSPLCTNTFGVATPHGKCNENQNSQPFTGPDGTLYVVWSNYNNTVSGTDNRNQILIARSTDGGNTFSAPVKVADYYDLPDCATYQSGSDFGRACVPEKGSTNNSIFRASNYPSGAVDPTNQNRVVVSFGSYINPHSNESNGCVPGGFATTGQNLFAGVKTPGACNNDILVSMSTDGGASFTGTSTDPRLLTSATPALGQATTDQWFQWAAFTPSGRLAISYYDRQYGNNEYTGYSDVSVSGSRDGTHFGVTRATSTSMPPPTQFSGLFWGDYGGLAALDQAHPVWSDTRNPELFTCPASSPPTPPSVCTATLGSGLLANDQDIFTVSVPVPTN